LLDSPETMIMCRGLGSPTSIGIAVMCGDLGHGALPMTPARRDMRSIGESTMFAASATARASPGVPTGRPRSFGGFMPCRSVGLRNVRAQRHPASGQEAAAAEVSP